MPEYMLVAVAVIGVIGYLFSRRYTHEAVYRRRRRREKAEYDAVMESRRLTDDGDRLS